MRKRRKKRGRPRTGRDPMIGVRLPLAQLKRVDKLATVLSCDRSGAIRWLLDLAMMGVPSILLRSGKGRNLTDAIAFATVDDIKAKAAADAVKRARPADKLQAEIKALRAEEQAEERRASIADRLALRRALILACGDVDSWAPSSAREQGADIPLYFRTFLQLDVSEGRTQHESGSPSFGIRR